MSKAFCNGNETIVKMIMTGVASHLLTGFSHYIRLDKGGGLKNHIYLVHPPHFSFISYGPT